MRSLEKKKHIEVSHAITYEGWEKNVQRVSLKNRKVLMTTEPTSDFWEEVQAFASQEYSLENTQIISNSDGGSGYSYEKFKEEFSQTCHPILHQLDAYHIGQALHCTLGWKKNSFKQKVKKAIASYHLDEFKL